MPSVYIGKRRKRKPENYYTIDNFDADNHLRSALVEKFKDFSIYMASINKPVVHIYHDNNSFIATDAEHTIALWDHLYSNWTGNNITDVIMNDEIMRYGIWSGKYL